MMLCFSQKEVNSLGWTYSQNQHIWWEKDIHCSKNHCKKIPNTRNLMWLTTRGMNKRITCNFWYVLIHDKCKKSNVHFWLWKPETLQLATWILVNCSKGYHIWNLGCARAPFIQHCAQSFILFHILLITSAKHLTVTNQLQWLTHNQDKKKSRK